MKPRNQKLHFNTTNKNSVETYHENNERDHKLLTLEIRQEASLIKVAVFNEQSNLMNNLLLINLKNCTKQIFLLRCKYHS